MCLFFGQGYEEVARLLTEGLAYARRWQGTWRVPTTAAITRARARLGPEPLRALFAEVCQPVATEASSGSFYRAWRLVAVDGTTFDLPDTAANAGFFGRPGSPRGAGKGAFPQVRIVNLVECGTHASVWAEFDGVKTSERVLTERMAAAFTDERADFDRIMFDRQEQLNAIVSADPDKQLSLKVDALKSFFPLKHGDTLDVDKLRKALKNYTSEYGRFGFIDFTAEPEFDIDDAKKIINVTLRFDEKKQYYVRRIDFSGNTTTRDKVIRRELMLDEGSLFDKRAWEISVLRLNQLDYFDRIEADKAVEIKRNTKEGTVDLNLKVKEKGKQSIGLNGGVSGLAGGFIGLTYQTNNFLGLGETLTFSAQFGSLQRSFMFGFTEPYLFDRPISTGFTIFSSRYSYDQAKQESLLFGQNVSINPQFIQNYNQDSTGFTAFASYPLRKFSFTRVGLTYGLTRTNITAFNDASKLLFQSVQYRSFAGPSALNGIVSSTITPTITYNSVDNPVNPTTGKSYLYTMAFTGGPLGGNVNTITNVAEYKQFRPINKRRNVLGYRARLAYTTGFGGKEIPPYSRFYMGGEDDIRGYDIRSISPVTFIPTATSVPVSTGVGSFTIPALIYTATLPGGDAEAFGNVEYRIPIVKTYFQTALFFDGGTSGIAKRNGLKLNPAALDDSCPPGSRSLACLFPTKKLNAGLPIASGTNFRLRGSAGVEFIIQLPIVQAPFRIYYAYNVHRLREQIVAQNPFIDPTQICEPSSVHDALAPCPVGFPFDSGFYPRTLSPDQWLDVKTTLRSVLNNPGRLNYFEPATTFRFTVSRTF
jgi:outer membrane protein assembly complex protein YaeT